MLGSTQASNTLLPGLLALLGCADVPMMRWVDRLWETQPQRPTLRPSCRNVSQIAGQSHGKVNIVWLIFKTTPVDSLVYRKHSLEGHWRRVVENPEFVGRLHSVLFSNRASVMKCNTYKISQQTPKLRGRLFFVGLHQHLICTSLEAFQRTNAQG